jgi:hypothetical protein
MSSIQSSSTDSSRLQQRFEAIFSQAHFAGLKAVLESLTGDREALCAGIQGSANYEQLVASLGHKLVLTRQIHVQDCYTRVGRAGGIRSVLPYHDIPTQSSLPTLVNFDGSLTTTPKAVAFFDALLREFQQQLHAQS